MREFRQRQGLNASEAGLAQAFARLGGGAEILDGLEPDAASDLRPIVEWLEDSDDELRESVLREWEETDGRMRMNRMNTGLRALSGQAGQLPSRWQRLLRGSMQGDGLPQIREPYLRRLVPLLLASGTEEQLAAAVDRGGERFLFPGLVDMRSDELTAWFRRVGLYQFAEVLRNQGRRSKARVLRELPEVLREQFRGYLDRRRSLEEGEQKRIQEAFIAISRQHPQLPEQMLHLGMYFVAAAAGSRFGSEVGELAERLPEPLGEELLEYYVLFLKGTRRDISRSVREALKDFARFEGWIEDSDEDSGEAEDEKTGASVVVDASLTQQSENANEQ